MTLEDLALMVKKGFDGVDEKFSGVDERFESVDTNFRAVFSDLDLVKQDIRDIKITLGPIVQMVATLQVDMSSLENRVMRLEKKAGVR